MPSFNILNFLHYHIIHSFLSCRKKGITLSNTPIQLSYQFVISFNSFLFSLASL
nr:MAG TPA: hypothetical protein [Caudoviricetes sp.]